MTDAEIAEHCAHVGKGWRTLVARALLLLPESARVLQIKEKFGSLRLYVKCAEHDRERVNRIVSIAERMSASMCEDCGKPGQRRSGGWIRTLCDGCVK